MFKPYNSDPYFDEMIDQNGNPREHYQRFYISLLQLNPEELKEKQDTANLNFLRQGITFTVYGNEGGTERTLPFDFIPIIIPSDKWKQIEKGMVQRVKALNLFLDDIYHDQNILNDGIIPPYFYYQQAGGVDIPLRNHIFLAGIDLIKDEKGVYRVLEDNLRNPSGMSYVYQNRYVMRQVCPEFFSKHFLNMLEEQIGHLHAALMSHLPKNARTTADPRAVLLTPGMYNSAYYDHVF